MQFAYQFPELVERLVLVASGGFGREVAPALRAATLPGTALALGTATRLTPQWVGKLLHRTARAVPGISRPEVDEVAQSITALADPGARDAFVHTVRSALDLGGQRLNGLERLRLVSDAPLLLIAGRKDLCIPTEHTTRAHDAFPGSRLELFPSAGHFPHRDHRCGSHRSSSTSSRPRRPPTPTCRTFGAACAARPTPPPRPQGDATEPEPRPLAAPPPISGEHRIRNTPDSAGEAQRG